MIIIIIFKKIVFENATFFPNKNYQYFISFQYSEQLRKLYINQNRFVNLEFRMEPLPETERNHFFVRAICIFIGADDYAEPVTVCYTHSRDSVGHVNINFTKKKNFQNKKEF